MTPDEPGVEVFGFEFSDEPEDGPLTRAEVARRLAEHRRREAEATRLPDDWLDNLQDALVPYRGMDRYSGLTRDPLVYFVQAETGGPIKIGNAVDYALRRRLTGLQIANHQTLVVRRLVYGGVTVERLLHAEFQGLRIRGEWFRDEDGLAELIRPNGVLRVVMGGC